MRTVKRIQGEHNPKQRLPITFQVLEIICNSLRSGVFSTFTDCMLETVCTMAFWGFLKGKKVLHYISNHTICPFSAIKKYLAVRRGNEAPFCLSDPLFIKEDGCAHTRSKRITNYLKYLKSNRKPLLGVMLSLDTFYSSHNHFQSRNSRFVCGIKRMLTVALHIVKTNTT
jgi:hypothetical protein